MLINSPREEVDLSRWLWRGADSTLSVLHQSEPRGGVGHLMMVAPRPRYRPWMPWVWTSSRAICMADTGRGEAATL